MTEKKRLFQDIDQVEPRQPDKKQEKDPVGTDHLHLFGAGQGWAEGHSQFRRRDSIAEQVEHPVEQAAGKKEKPKRKGDLS